MPDVAVDPWAPFERRMRDVEDLDQVVALAGWDEQTYCSARGHEARAQAMAVLAAIRHERIVEPAYGDAIEAAAAAADGDPVRTAMVREVRHERERAVRQPAELVRALAEQGSRTNRAWETARRARDFRLYAPELERMVALKQQQADALGHGGERYDALLDAFEPGMRLEELAPILDGLRERLVPFAERVLAAPAPDVAVLRRSYAHDGQWDFSLLLLRELGFDFEAGRQDLSTHPFTGGPGPWDVRLTTRIFEDWLPGLIFSTIHEAGHGLYEQGQDAALRRTSVGHAPSLGAHESQSRFYENVLGRSRAFWEHFLPALRERFPAQLDGVDVDAFWRAVNHVQRSAIRVEADEVTYNLHILVRFELELALLRGDLAVRDLPGAWNERMEAIVGYRPADDVEGVMQDIHWSWGELGYFPTYTLGNLYAAQIAEAMRRDLDVDGLVATGAFAPILGWLRERIHGRGSVLPAADLMRDVTGQELGHEAFMRYLETKYSALYDL